MQLHQLLRIIPSNIPIKILDYDENEVCSVLYKAKIPVEIFEEDVVRLTAERNIIIIQILK